MVALADRLQSFAQGDLVSEFPECNTEDEIAYMIRVAKEMADNLNLILRMQENCWARWQMAIMQ